MTITISADDPRSIKAIEIAGGAARWLKCKTADGQKAYGIQPVPAQPLLSGHQPELRCPDFKRHGLTAGRVGVTGLHTACKHVLAVRLHVELAKAQQALPKPRRLQPVPTAADYDRIFARF
jgi:hypothetical protein